jgi:hypothetical protein
MFELYAMSAGAYEIQRRSILSTCACNHLKAARLSFLSGVRFVKLYVTDTSGKNLRTQHCIVNLYRSVSKRDVMPSGRFASIAAMMVCV